MIDRFFLPAQRRVLGPIAKVVVWSGISADAVTVIGFAVGLAALPLLWLAEFGWALAAIAANRVLDGVDGAVARLTRPTDRGAFLDISLDFVFYATVPLGFALADPAANALAASLLIASFVGTGSSFLAFAILAERRRIDSDHHARKGIFYLGGLTEGAETILAFVAMCVWPHRFPEIALVFAALCLLTTIGRWRQGWTVFGDNHQSTPCTGANPSKASGSGTMATARIQETEI